MPTNQDSPRGVLIVGHGTRSATGAAEFLRTCELVSQSLAGQTEPTEAGWIVRPAFLELQRPTIAEAIDELASQGVRQLVVMPLLLFSAGHAQRDIPQAVEAAISRHERIEAKFAAHLGLHSCVVRLSWQRCQEFFGREGVAITLNNSTPDTATIPPERTALVLVGRGSQDDSATAEMLRFAELRRVFDPQVRHESVKTRRLALDEEAASGLALQGNASRVNFGQIAVGFYAMARPAWTKVLDRLVADGFRRIVVQPHLLFHGEILESIEREVIARRSRPELAGIDWRIVERLGVSELLAQAVIERVAAIGF